MEASPSTSVLPSSFTQLAAAVVDHVGELYNSKNPACALEKNQKTFFELIAGYNFESSLNSSSPFVKTTFNISGFDLLEEENFILELGGQATDQEWFRKRTSFAFVYSIGGVSRFPNMNARLAAGMNAHLYLLNQALMAFMKGLQMEMMSPEKRLNREIALAAVGPSGSGGSGTFSSEGFLDAYNRFITALRGLSQIFTQSDVDLAKSGELNELLGFNEPLADGEADFEEKALGDVGDLMDTLFTMHTILELSDHDFKIRDAAGSDHDLNDLTLDILRGAIEASFDETMDEHHFKRSVVEARVNQMLFNFYTIFWRNYLGNLVPMILMSFLNFTHAASVFDLMKSQPFLTTLRGVGLTEELGLDSEEVSFNLKWFQEDKQSDGGDDGPSAAEQEEMEVMKMAVDAPLRRTTLQQAFESYSNHFNGEVEEGLQHAESVLDEYSKDIVNRRNALYSSFTVQMKEEMLLQEAIFANGARDASAWSRNLLNLLQQRISEPYGVNYARLVSYLSQGMQLTHSYIFEETGIDMAKAPFAFASIMHLLVKWYGISGIPSHKLFLFNTWLKALRPLAESLGIDGQQDMDEGGQEEGEGEGERGGGEWEELPPFIEDEDPWEITAAEEQQDDQFFPDLSKLAVTSVGRSGIPSFLRGVTLLPPSDTDTNQKPM